jgi:hypothetical protein
MLEHNDHNDHEEANLGSTDSGTPYEINFSMGDFSDADSAEAYQNTDDVMHPALEALGAAGTNPMVAYEVEDEAADISEEAIATNELPLPGNITDILDTSLIDAGMRGANTQKYYIDGHPDLLVRLNLDAPPEMVREAKASADRMIQCGVNVLPSTVVPHGGKAYVVTQLVNGCDLREALIDNPSDELLNEVDQTWKGVCDSLVDCHQTGSPMPSDITRPEQYMRGTTATDQDPRVRLVDLPCYAISQSEGDRFAFELLDAANAINEIERLTGQPMAATRQAIENALAICPDSEEYGDGVPNSIRHALAEGVIMYGRDDADFINQMRTH